MISDFFMVAYYDKFTGELVKIVDYQKTKGKIMNYQSDIDSYKYGYDAKVIDPADIISKEFQSC